MHKALTGWSLGWTDDCLFPDTERMFTGFESMTSKSLREKPQGSPSNYIPNYVNQRKKEIKFVCIYETVAGLFLCVILFDIANMVPF